MLLGDYFCFKSAEALGSMLNFGANKNKETLAIKAS